MKPIELFINRVIQADAVSLLPHFPDECIDFVLTDPPYLVNYRPRDGRRCSGDTTDRWLRPVFRELYRLLKPNSFCATFYGWPCVERFAAVWKECGFRPVSHLVWKKSHASYTGYTQGFHEVGFLLAKGRPKRPLHPPPDVLPWEYTGNKHHPNEKPIIALTPLIEAYSKQGHIVLDPFCGSGATGIAAKVSRRRFILIDIEKHHCQTARRRLLN